MALLTVTIKNLLALFLLAALAAPPAAAATFSMKRGINLDNWVTWPGEDRWGDASVMLPFPEWRRSMDSAQLKALKDAGFDFVRPDMMFSSIDWKELDHIIRASALADLTTMVRVPNNPWFGGTDNVQCVVDAARAFSIGADAVQVSVASTKQVEALLHIAKDWHRSGPGPEMCPSFDRVTYSGQIRSQQMSLCQDRRPARTRET